MFNKIRRTNVSQKMFKKLGRTNVSQQSAPPNVSQLQWPRNFEATFEAGPPVFSQSFFLSFLDLLCCRSRNRGISVSRPFSLVLRPFCSCQTLKCDQIRCEGWSTKAFGQKKVMKGKAVLLQSSNQIETNRCKMWELSSGAQPQWWGLISFKVLAQNLKRGIGAKSGFRLEEDRGKAREGRGKRWKNEATAVFDQDSSQSWRLQRNSQTLEENRHTSATSLW